MAQDLIEHGDVRANSKDGSHRPDRGERARTGRKTQGKRSRLAVIGWQLRMGHDVGPGSEGEASRRMKELLRHVGKCGERHDDGFVAPIVSCLYDHEGVVVCWSIGGCGLQ
jgi:hypothetical protein